MKSSSEIGSTRRELLVGGVRVSALSLLASELAPISALGARPSDQRALVVVELTGGNDGLNTVCPVGQDEYYRMRPTLAVARDAVHHGGASRDGLGEGFGLHPALSGLFEIWEQGHLAIVHGVASPLVDRSHFRALEMWHTARPFEPAGPTGWLGRMADRIADPYGLPALALGEGELPLSMRGEHTVAPAVPANGGFRLQGMDPSLERARDELLELPRESELDFLARTARATYDAVERMQELDQTPGPVDYPEHDFAAELALVARLIAGSFGTRIFHLRIGGFDTHARQAPVHGALLQRLSNGLSAFQKDLAARGVDDRITTLVFSEFGRRARENGSAGTDHGVGAPVFVVGSKVRAGQYGQPCDLRALSEGDVPGTTDFRSVYAALERDWMGLDSKLSTDPLPLF